MFKLFLKYLRERLAMRFFSGIILVSMILIIFFFNSNLQAQRKYYDKGLKSSSLKSTASEVFNSNKINSNQRKSVVPDLSYSKIKNNNFQNSESDEISSESYFRIDNKRNSLWDGKHWSKSSFPLNIYVQGIDSRYYKSSYKNYVKYAMDVWRKADDRIMYNFVNSINNADIAVVFVENLGDEYEENYLGLTDYDTDKNKEIKFTKIQISLLKNGNEKISAGEIKATIIHELGHAFGLGHSENKNDLMYPYISPLHTSEMTYDELSSGDKLAIKDLIDLSYSEKYVWK